MRVSSVPLRRARAEPRLRAAQMVRAFTSTVVWHILQFCSAHTVGTAASTPASDSVARAEILKQADEIRRP
jgi:hypothetical protein